MTKITLIDGEFDLKVGDSIYVVEDRERNILTISKIGAKYFYVKCGRYDLKFEISSGLEFYGPSSCGLRAMCYSSKEAVEGLVELRKKLRTVIEGVNSFDRFDIAKNRDIINKIYDIVIERGTK